MDIRASTRRCALRAALRFRRIGRYVVNVDMAGKTTGKTFVKRRSMRLAVTVAACGDRAVPVLVARNAGNRFMFAETFSPGSINPGMTGTTGIRRQILAVLNLSRHVRRMACNAGG